MSTGKYRGTGDCPRAEVIDGKSNKFRRGAAILKNLKGEKQMSIKSFKGPMSSSLITISLIRKARGGNLKKFIAWFVVATFFVAFAPALATAPPERAQVIIVFKERPNAALITGLGGEVITTYRIIPGLAARVPTGALDELRKNPAIAYIEPDAVVYALEQRVPWGISRIGAPSAWSFSTGGDVKVAILDTGVQHDHPDLAANVKGGISVVGDENSTDNADWNDGHGHGTHVAGIVAAVNNDVGVVGSAPAAWLYGVKVLSDSGEGPVSDVIEGIDWSVQNGMQVLNLSLGTDVHVSAFEDACDQACEAGLLLVAAAGNKKEAEPPYLSYPAAYDSVIAVASTNSNDQAPSSSNSGSFVELAAPGVSIYSTYKGSTYATFSGTSMAAPHVSGTAALVWARKPSLANVQVRSILQQTAEDLGPTGRDTVYGYGLVRADEAVQTNILTLRPDASGEYTEYTTVSGAAEHWDAVNDVAPDEDNTHIETKTAGHRDTFNLENSGLPNVPIHNVRVYGRARRTTGVAKINLMVRTCDNGNLSEDMALTSSYATHYRDWAVNPHTGGSWTVSEVDALQAGVRSASPNNHRVTQVYVDVTYKMPTHGVEVSISPLYQENLPGENLTYIVTVTNTGDVEDNYDVSVSQTEDWEAIFWFSFTDLPASSSAQSELIVIIPENAIPGTQDNITVTATSKNDPSVKDNASCIAQAKVVREVEVSVLENYQENENGGTLAYTVMVTNTGNVPDNYALEKIDTMGWGLSISEDLLEVENGMSENVTLTVVIPDNAIGRTLNNITVTATSQENENVWDSGSCLAQVRVVVGVDVRIEPSWQRYFVGENISYAVTVVNTGNVPDNYTLTVGDNAGWGPWLSEDRLENIWPGKNKPATLIVTIPENAAAGTEDNIIVEATSAENAEMSGNASCIARATVPKTEFSFVTLYKVSLDINILLENGSKLVAKFYKYDNATFQAESVIDEFTPPKHVENIEDIPHPLGLPVEIVTLFLTTDNTEEEIYTVGSFTVCKDDLRTRFREIPMEWGLEPDPERKAKLRDEFRKIPMQWGLSPC